jgi:hypothetical protein
MRFLWAIAATSGVQLLELDGTYLRERVFAVPEDTNRNKIAYRWKLRPRRRDPKRELLMLCAGRRARTLCLSSFAIDSSVNSAWGYAMVSMRPVDLLDDDSLASRRSLAVTDAGALERC